MGVPLSRCSLVARSCGVCVALQDPYCAWSVREGQCVSLENSNVETLDSASFLQNVLTGRHEACGHDSSLDLTDDLAHSGIKVYLTDFKDNLPLASGSIVKSPSHMDVLVEEDTLHQDHSITASNPIQSTDSLVPGLTTTPLEPIHHYSAEELSMAVATLAFALWSLDLLLDFCWPEDVAVHPGTTTIPTTCLTLTSLAITPMKSTPK